MSLLALAFAGYAFASLATGGSVVPARLSTTHTTDTTATDTTATDTTTTDTTATDTTTTDTTPTATDTTTTDTTATDTTTTDTTTTDTTPTTTDTTPTTTDTTPTTTDTTPTTTVTTPTTSGGVGSSSGTPPTLTISAPDGPIEATEPGGAVVYYTASASDREDGGITPTCRPASGSLLPLGTSTIVCTAGDSDGNKASASLSVVVRDTTPPVLTSPRDLEVKSSGPVSRFAPLIVAWLSFLEAVDLVDPSLFVGSNAPTVLLPGPTLVIFTAVDDSGNVTTEMATVRVSATSGVLPDSEEVPLSAQPDFPPGNVENVKVSYGNLAVRLSWTPPEVEDFAYVEILRSPGRDGEDESSVYKGVKTSLKDRGLGRGKQYLYVLVAYDEGGNRAAGVAVVVVARTSFLLAPPDGAVLSRAPRLRWKAVKKASYYNVQVYRGRTKVLSRWPAGASIQLSVRWRFDDRRYELGPGLYRWYVWPGFGNKVRGRYGQLLGQSEFVIEKAGKAAG